MEPMAPYELNRAHKGVTTMRIDETTTGTKRGRGRPALPDDQKRNALQIRLRDDVREKLRTEAEARGVSLAAHIESVLLAHLGEADPRDVA